MWWGQFRFCKRAPRGGRDVPPLSTNINTWSHIARSQTAAAAAPPFVDRRLLPAAAETNPLHHSKLHYISLRKKQFLKPSSSPAISSAPPSGDATAAAPVKGKSAIWKWVPIMKGKMMLTIALLKPHLELFESYFFDIWTVYFKFKSHWSCTCVEYNKMALVFCIVHVVGW